jgi:hypothetical protein
VQITAGVVSNSWRLGTIPSIDTPTPIQITGMTHTGTNVWLQWTSFPGPSYEVQWNDQLGSAWQTIATVLGAGTEASFTDTDVARLSQPTGFYRIYRP